MTADVEARAGPVSRGVPGWNGRRVAGVGATYVLLAAAGEVARQVEALVDEVDHDERRAVPIRPYPPRAAIACRSNALLVDRSVMFGTMVLVDEDVVLQGDGAPGPAAADPTPVDAQLQRAAALATFASSGP